MNIYHVSPGGLWTSETYILFAKDKDEVNKIMENEINKKFSFKSIKSIESKEETFKFVDEWCPDKDFLDSLEDQFSFPDDSRIVATLTKVYQGGWAGDFW